MLFSYKTLTHAVAGSTGSVVAMSVFFPLETVRSRMQLQEGLKGSTVEVFRKLLKSEGIATLYRGIVPVLQSVCASNFVYFYTFHGLKLMHESSNQSVGRDLLLAIVAGSVNVIATTPLWVVNTRMKMQIDDANPRYRSLLHGLFKLGKEEGVGKLWSGIGPSLILVSNPALQFMTYEAVKRQLKVMFPAADLGPLAYFFVGALSKAVATLLTYPLQIIQTKLRHGHQYEDLSPNADMFDLSLYILKKYGIAGLYKGLESKLLQTILTAALMFSAYEKIAAFVFMLLRASNK